MKVLLVSQEYPPGEGGAGAALQGLARALAARGHAVRVVTAAASGAAADAEPGLDVRRVEVPGHRGGPFRPRELLAFAQLATRACGGLCAGPDRPDVFHAFFTIPGGWIGRAMKRRFGLPLVVSLRGSDVPGFRYPAGHPWYLAARPVLRAVWRAADAVVANSDELRDLAARSWRGPIRVVPNGVDAGVFAPAPGANPRAAPVVLVVSQLIPRKNVAAAIRALPALRRETGRDVRLRIAGRGPLRVDLEREAAALGVAGHVRFEGARPRAEMPELYRDADAFLLLSEREGLSNALLEAMASGLPCFVTRGGDAGRLLRPGVNGDWIDPARVDGFAALAAALRDPAMARRLGAAAREGVRTEYSWDRAAAAYEAIYGEFARGSRVGGSS